MSDSAAPAVIPLDRLELVRDPLPWALAEQRRAEIDAHFAALQAANPDLWNGRILLLGQHSLAGGVLTGSYKEADFASLLWWRDSGFPDPTIRNAFAMGALVGADGGFILGRMAAWTANAGRIYFAAGTPEPGDVLPDGRVDLEGSVTRELMEETGLGAGDVTPDPGWHGVFAGPRIAFMRRLVTRQSAAEVADRIRAHIAGEERPELDEVVVVRSPEGITEAMPDFIGAYLRAVWEGDAVPGDTTAG